MGFLDALAGGDGMSVVSGGFSRPSEHRRHSSRHHKKHRSRSRSRSSSRHRHSHSHRKSSGGGVASFFGLDNHSKRSHSHYDKHNSSKSSFFGIPNASRGSFFGLNNKSSSYYKRSPRQGFMQRAYKQLKKILRNLVHHAKRNPWKVFFLVIMPLVSGGVLTALLARFGLRMPAGLERMLGMASRAASGDHFGLVNDAVRMAGNMGGGSASHVHAERHSTSTSYGGGGSDDWMGGFKNVAKMFS